MSFTTSNSDKAQKAIALVRSLQAKLVNALEAQSQDNRTFSEVSWFRDEGIHGGGSRFVADDSATFNRASVNVSHVHYDDQPERMLASATAISAIVHPTNPHCPSTHMHFSWTELRDGSGYWRMMADLNPSITNEANKKSFVDQLKNYSVEQFESGIEQGDRYFFIPALGRHRGVSHFYLEGFDRGDFDQDYNFTDSLASNMIAVYKEIIEASQANHPTFTSEEKQAQLDYHTLYLYQVLTLDKGTIAGILVHDQNDLGVMGSLPAVINGKLFHSWIEKTSAPFNELVSGLSDVIGQSDNCPIEDEQKIKFTEVMRSFYRKYPELADFKKLVSNSK